MGEQQQNPGLIVALAPSPRGLRHYIDPFSTYERTLCGLMPLLWQIDIKGGPASCSRCKRTASRHRFQVGVNRAELSSQSQRED